MRVNLLRLEKEKIIKMNLEDLADNIKTKKDFEFFLEKLYSSLKSNPENWENITLEDFLEALTAYTKDLEGYYKNWNISHDTEKPSWKMFSDILLGARIYE